jgi:hypothetical protein
MSRRPNITSEKGQTAVEFALVLPMLLVLLLGVIQFGVAFNHYLTVTDAARVAARKAIVARLAGGSPAIAEAEQAGRDAAGDLNPTQFQIKVTSTDWTTSGSVVTATATYPYDIKLLNWVVASGTLTSQVKERLE